jgi:type VI secretion system protein VasJ
MLGIGRAKTGGEFSAYGKHPAFDDFFNLNVGSPLALALSSWVENGAKLAGKQVSHVHSFRFWMRGIQKDEVVLGLIRDSSDRLGRPYPLLIMGRGILENRDRRWPHIFWAYETVYRAFEELAAFRHEDFKAFETRLARINFIASSSGHDPEVLRMAEIIPAWFRANGKKEWMALPIASLMAGTDSIPLAGEVRGLFRKKPEVPAAVFLGGVPENSVLTIYRRPLKTYDFSKLFDTAGNSSNMTVEIGC